MKIKTVFICEKCKERIEYNTETQTYEKHNCKTEALQDINNLL